MEAQRSGRSMAYYENDDNEPSAVRPALKQRSRFGGKLSKLFGGAKTTSAPAKPPHHEYGKVSHVYTAIK